MKIRRGIRAATAVLLLASAVVACGSGSAKTKNGLGTTELKVGTLPIVDDAPFFIAQRDGYFAHEGLNVHQETLANGAAGLVRLQSGSIDLAWTSYPTVVNAEASHATTVRIAVDGYAARPHLFPILTARSSGIRTAADLAGKKLAVNSLKGLGPLMLAAAGIPKSVKLTEIPFPHEPAALQSHAVDAIWVTEPFATEVSQAMPTREVADTSGGKSADLPIAGFSVSGKALKKYPKAIAAFQRAMARAQRTAQDRKKVEQILPTYVKGLTAQTAAKIVIGHYPTSTSRKRLQHVADLMSKYKLIKHPLNFGRLLVPAPS